MLHGLFFVLLLAAQSQISMAQDLNSGDSRVGYERKDFVTSSRRIDTLRARPADLHQLAANPPASDYRRFPEKCLLRR